MATILPIHAIYDGTTIKGYIRTSDVYGESGALGIKVGIKKVKEVDLTGEELIIPVKEGLRVALISRITIRYKTSSGARKSAKILVAKKRMAAVFGDLPADNLTNTEYKIGTVVRGTIKSIGIARRATNY